MLRASCTSWASVAQKPERRALERDEEKIEEWKRKTLAAGKKNARAGCPHRLCDESGFMMIPAVRARGRPSGRLDSPSLLPVAIASR